MRVTELARAGGVTAETVRHYTREGLLRPRRDPRNGYQLYDTEALGRLRLIDSLRSLGLNLKEINLMLPLAEQDSTPAADTCAPLADRAPRIHSRIQELQAIATWLDIAMRGGTHEALSLSELIEAFGSAQPTTVTGCTRRGHQ